MCGILCILGCESGEALRPRALELQKKLRHRGPDWNGTCVRGRHVLCHERLAIVDPESGDQPIFGRDDDSLVLAVNGEIYNHKALAAAHLSEEDRASFRTASDCEVLLHLFRKWVEGESQQAPFLAGKDLRGMFACVALDARTDRFIVARDPVGMIPLYYGHGRDGAIWVASEMKALVEDCVDFHEFPPGHVFDSQSGKFHPWLLFDEDGKEKTSPFFVADHRQLATYPAPPTERLPLQVVRESLEATVRSHMMSDVPYGVLLSGGLDSSLVASIMARHCRLRQEADPSLGLEAHWPRLHSFCIGLKGSPDLAAAAKVAKFLGTVHHPYTFTVQQGLDALSDVIAHVETFDVTTVRASTPMFLLSRKIRALGVKMVLSGEGADEAFGGYLYFHKAPDKFAFHQECVRKMAQLSKYDCARANKAMMAWSVEARTPFLDRSFLEKAAFAADPAQKMCVHDDVAEATADGGKKVGDRRCEKWMLRKAFDVQEEDGRAAYLPPELLWRQKEQFSDGVGYSWIDALQAHADSIVTDADLASAAHRFPEKTPLTKEAYMYRDMFSRHFGGDRNPAAIGCVAWQASIACSSETALAWDASFRARADASGRAVAGVHEDAYADERMAKRAKVEAAA